MPHRSASTLPLLVSLNKLRNLILDFNLFKAQKEYKSQSLKNVGRLDRASHRQDTILSKSFRARLLT
jgi:hypothetical protein